jgi:iron complex transport system substrate-binding protein
VPLGVLSATLALLGFLAAGGPATFVDALGHRVTLPEPPRRIVSLSPNLTEMLFAVGCDTTEIVGVTRFCNYPPAARRVAPVGGIVDPSLESILERRPDLVLATRGNPLEFILSLTRLGLPVYALEDRGSLERIPQNVAAIGAVVGRGPQAEALASDLRARLQAVAARTGGLPDSGRPVVYFGELDGALWTAGPGSYIDDLIRAAGGTNAAAGAPSAWCALSLEAIVAADPQVYLGTFAGEDTEARRREAEDRARERVTTREAWRETRLGRAPRLFLVHEDRLQRPGPRVIDVLEEFARFLHPERRAEGP